jgi:hypothetical protein
VYLVPFVEDDYTVSRTTLLKTIPVAGCWVDHVSAGSMFWFPRPTGVHQ